MADVLAFYSKSADVRPGRGVHERVADFENYRALASIPNWRKVLSNFHVYPFAYEGNTYMTIEHVFQAVKISLADPAKAWNFTVESGTALGRGDGAAAQKARKLVVLNPTQLRAWDSIKDRVMEKAATEKFEVCQEFRTVLSATGCAALCHLVTQRGRTSSLVRFYHLERLRITLL